MIGENHFSKTALNEFNKKNYQGAIEAFKKSLALHENWQSYQGLGFALNSTNQHQQAIEAFNKSLALHEDWQSYQGLGLALGSIRQYKQSHECIVASIKRSFHTNHIDFWSRGIEYAHLAHALNKSERVESAKRAFQIHLRQSPNYPHKLIDPLFGMQNGITVTRDLINKISENFYNSGYSFHPSFLSGKTKDVQQLQSWKHLIHIHIPKCAGTNFIEPLRALMAGIEFEQQSRRHFNAETKHYLWTGNLGQKYVHDAYLLEMLNGRVALNDLHGSLMANHTGKYGTYNQHLRELGISTKKICLLRDPSTRLYSHIRNMAATIHDRSTLLKTTRQECFNIMDRYIYDYNLFDKYEELPYCDPFDYKRCEEIEFFEMSDRDAISKVKSSFLSATLMPNLVQYNRLNFKKDLSRIKGSLGEKDCQDIHRELISQGFLDRDKQIDLKHLKERTNERILFPDVIHQGTTLHPITFIYNRVGDWKFILTKDFIAEQLDTMNHSIQNPSHKIF